MTAPIAQRQRPGPRVLLLVEDDPDTANLLSVYFGGFNYRVEVAARGQQGIASAMRCMPDLVLLDIGLPDITGYQVCAALRESPRTSHIPIVFMSEKGGLKDRVAGLSAGAQDYVTKPFDLEELRLRVHNLITRSVRENLVDPRTNLPTGSWVDDQLRRLDQPGWHVLECRVEAFQPFVDLNGFVAGDEVLKFAAQLHRDVLDELGTPGDFIGQPANDTFLIASRAADPAALAAELQSRFNQDIQSHYSFVDREQGYITLSAADGQPARAPLMTLAVTVRPHAVSAQG
jgi:CheY-like chemotaxis protein